MKFAVVACFVTVIAAGIGSAANAADASYIGTWKLTGAVVAPWADPKQKPDSAEMRHLLNKTVVFQARQIAGPPPFACKAPHYRESDFTADMLFQEMQSKNKSIDPNKLATSLGFTGKTIKTLETGCELDFRAARA